jgi:hypothetical protein
VTAAKTIPEQVKDMEDRAKRYGVDVQAICAAAGIARSTWQNWKSGKFSPRLVVWEAAKDALATAIEASDPGPTRIRRR